MIEVDEQAGVTVLRMADGKANAMSLEFCELLTARFQTLGSSPSSAVVITGTGRIFSAGVDLLRLLDGGAPYIRKFLPALSTMLTTVFSFPKPVVAAVNGHAIAGGCVLACAVDQRLMAREAGRIGVTELLVGVPFPSVAMEIMRCATTSRYFEEAIFGGATYAPAEAAQRGLANEIVASEELLAGAVARAKALAAISPSAFALTKRQMRQPALERVAGDTSRDEVEQIWTAPETLERIRAYVARTLRK
jgi:enoyl-CoA hydratase